MANIRNKTTQNQSDFPMTKNIIQKYIGLLTFLLLCLTGTVEASNKATNQGIMIVAYDGTAWYPYILGVNNRWNKIKEIKDPSGVTWQPESGDFFVKGNDRKLYFFDSTKRLLSPLKSLDTQAEKNSGYTQLRAYDQGIVMVKLVDGKSRDTQLIEIGNQSKTKTLLKQASAQFHPFRYKNYLYYAHVSCRMECSPLIQEVWRKDLTSGKTEQLSLLNAVSYLHSIDGAGQYGFLSSNKNSFYHIARMNLKTHNVTWLTEGQVTDSFPSIADNGDLYFIRHMATGSKLMMLEKKYIQSNKITEQSYKQISLPKEIQKVRYLELLN
jgi:ABC-type uncharacterized transport system permease subunit